MQYLIQNTSSFSGTPYTIFLDSSAQWNSLILKPGDTAAVPEIVLAELTVSGTTQYGGPVPTNAITIIGPTIDTDAPVAKTVTLPGVGSWTLVTLGRFCSNIKFITTSTTCLVSFSGWNTALGQTVPPVQYQVPIVADSSTDGNAFTLDMPMNSCRSMYVSGTGSLTIIGL